jgi:hypothetical protein
MTDRVRRWRVHAIVWLLAAAAASAQAPDPARQADRATVRLKPSEVRTLPKALQAALEERGCTIPQTFIGGPPHNVIKGHFVGVRSNDWAVLCSRNNVSVILVFGGGMPDVVNEIGRERDATSLQRVDPGSGRASFMGYSRTIDPVSPAYIQQHNEPGTLPQPLNHEGIEDSTGKGSVIWYWANTRWVTLRGAN